MLDSGTRDWLFLPLSTTYHCIISDGVVNGIGRKLSDSSVELMAPHTTPIYDFCQVKSAVMTPTTTSGNQR